MSDVNVGFGKVLRKHLFVPRDDSPAAMKERHDEAYALLEKRRELRLAGEDTAAIENAIRKLGYKFTDEPDADDGRYSYHRYR